MGNVEQGLVLAPPAADGLAIGRQQFESGGRRGFPVARPNHEAAGFQCETIKMSEVIRSWADRKGREIPDRGIKKLVTVKAMQNLGDEIRTADPSGVARLCLAAIAEKRAELTGQAFKAGEAVKPDNTKRAHLIDGVRHPAEISLFRRAYGAAFALVGVVCREDVRRQRILEKYLNKQEMGDGDHVNAVEEFIARDADDSDVAYGQHVTAAFHEADFFIDNTADDMRGDRGILEEPLARLVAIVTHSRIIRPTIEETAMHHAHSARVRSACLSRQVGAALVDTDGTVVATGTNEVPKAGGGVYGEQSARAQFVVDNRCAFRPGEKFCSSNREQSDPGAFLIAARILKGLSQKDLARRLGLREQAIQRWEGERYRSISLSNFQKVAQSLGVKWQMQEVTPLTEEWGLSYDVTRDDLSKLVRHARAQGWLTADEGSEENAIATLVRHIGDHVIRYGTPSLLRTGLRSNDRPESWALLSWKAQVTRRAEAVIAAERPRYRPIGVSWLIDLVRLSQLDDGPNGPRGSAAEPLGI